MDIRDEKYRSVNIFKLEKTEQELAKKYIQPNDVVLELGARYGSVSCIINSKLSCKTHQVVVEPDRRVWGALQRNKIANKCGFYIVRGFISSKHLSLTNLDDYHGGYGSTSVEDDNTNIPSFSLLEIKEKYNLNFNVLVADCEGFLETFFDENPEFHKQLRLIIFEADYPEKCNYDKIKQMLREDGFECDLQGFQNVFIKPQAL